MQETSALYRQILADENHYFETKLDIDGVGTFYEDSIFEISTDIAMFSGSPKVGGAVAAEIDVKLLNNGYASRLDGDYLNVDSATLDGNGYLDLGSSATLSGDYIVISDSVVDIPKMACLRPYVRVCGYVNTPITVTINEPNLQTNSATVSGTNITFTEQAEATVVGRDLRFPVSDETSYAESEWIPQGVYFIDTREVTQNQDGLDVLTIHGFDAMLKGEQIYNSPNITGDSADKEMVSEIARIIGVDVDARTYPLMNSNYRIPFPIQYTYREILGYIASMYFGAFVMTDEGKLRLISLLDLPAETNYLIDNLGNAILFGGDRILV